MTMSEPRRFPAALGRRIHHNLDDILNTYNDPATGFRTDAVVPVMTLFTLSELTEVIALDRSTLSRSRTGTTQQYRDNQKEILKGLARLCAHRLRALGLQTPRDSASALTVYLRTQDDDGFP